MSICVLSIPSSSPAPSSVKLPQQDSVSDSPGSVPGILEPQTSWKGGLLREHNSDNLPSLYSLSLFSSLIPPTSVCSYIYILLVPRKPQSLRKWELSILPLVARGHDIEACKVLLDLMYKRKAHYQG